MDSDEEEEMVRRRLAERVRAREEKGARGAEVQSWKGRLCAKGTVIGCQPLN